MIPELGEGDLQLWERAALVGEVSSGESITSMIGEWQMVCKLASVSLDK